MTQEWYNREGNWGEGDGELSLKLEFVWAKRECCAFVGFALRLRMK